MVRMILMAGVTTNKCRAADLTLIPISSRRMNLMERIFTMGGSQSLKSNQKPDHLLKMTQTLQLAFRHQPLVNKQRTGSG